MPYVWVEPEKFMSEEETGDVAVYHCHDQNCLMRYHYQIQSDESDSNWMAFDIRDLANEVCPGVPVLGDRDMHKSIIRLAVQSYPLGTWLIETEIWYKGETE